MFWSIFSLQYSSLKIDLLWFVDVITDRDAWPPQFERLRQAQRCQDGELMRKPPPPPHFCQVQLKVKRLYTKSYISKLVNSECGAARCSNRGHQVVTSPQQQSSSRSNITAFFGSHMATPEMFRPDTVCCFLQLALISHTYMRHSHFL